MSFLRFIFCLQKICSDMFHAQVFSTALNLVQHKTKAAFLRKNVLQIDKSKSIVILYR